MTAVAVVGLGAMGSRIARRLLGAGHELTVWNRDPAKAEPLAAAGATVASSPAEAARGVEAVVTMVRDPAALAAVTESDDGVVAELCPGAVLVQMSTVGPQALERLARLVPEHALLDAPVLGSISEADEGTLKVFAAGEDAIVERLLPLLSVLGTVLRVGRLGAGTAAKLTANLTLVGVIGVLGEALALAAALGLPQDVAFEVLEATPLGEQARRRRPAFEAHEYPPRFPLSLARKDAELILSAAAEHGLDLRLAESAREWLANAEGRGRGAEDYSSVLEQITGH
jgi:3-hydroxyisobutyrate dehydrogenase-like beta-hydroxyacid dehydrogenase